MDPAHRIRIFSVLFLSIFTAILGLGIIIPILPIYAQSDSIGANGFWLGAIFAGFSIARSVSMPLVGRCSDNTGRRKSFIGTGLFIYAVSSLGYIYAYDALSLLLVRMVQGCCSAMIVPIAMAYIGDICPKDREGSYMGMFTVSLFLGFGFGPFIGGVIQDFFSVNAAFIIMGALCCLAFIFVMMWLPASQSSQHAEKPPPSSFGHILRFDQIRGIICYRFISSFARAAVLTFLPLYVGKKLSLSGFHIGLIISAGVLATSFLQYPCGKLADTMNRKALIIAGNLFYSASILFFPFTETFLQVLGLNMLMGILGAVSLPAATAVVVEEGKRHGMGSTMAVFNVAMSLGLGSGPLVTGIIHDVSGLNSVFYAAAGLGILGTLVAGHFLHYSPPPPMPPSSYRVAEDI